MYASEKNQFSKATQSDNLDPQSSDKDLDLETAGRWTSDSWAGVAGYQPPLTAEDEATYTAYVQVYLANWRALTIHCVFNLRMDRLF